MQVVHELGGADQIIDTQTDVDRSLQPQQACRLSVEPDDFMLRAQDDDPIRKRRRRAAQFAVQLHQALFMELLAPMQAHHLRHHVAPDTAEVGRIHPGPQTQPAIEPMQIEQLPPEIETRGRQQPEPNGSDQQAGTQTRDQDSGETREREGPHRCHGRKSSAFRCPATRTGIPNRARSAPNAPT